MGRLEKPVLKYKIKDAEWIIKGLENFKIEIKRAEENYFNDLFNPTD